MTLARVLFWVALAATAGVYGAMVGWSLPRVSAMAGGLVPFDMRPTGYTPGEAQAFVLALSDEGRGFYLNVQQGLDFVFPALSALVLVWSFRWLSPGMMGRVLGLVAKLGSAFDYLENFSVQAMLLAGADGFTDRMAQVANRYTLLKSLFVTLSLVALLGLLVAVIVRKIRKGSWHR